MGVGSRSRSPPSPLIVFSPLSPAVSGYLLELLNRSEVALQETFAPSMGLLYSQNAVVFADLYTELRRYCRTFNVNLEETLNDFWARLLEKLFNQANRQYIIGKPERPPTSTPLVWIASFLGSNGIHTTTATLGKHF